MVRVCSIHECGKRHYARGWCKMHYRRWETHGDPMVCLTLLSPRGEPERFFREVVLAHKGNDCLLWPYAGTTNGYGKMRANGRQMQVHRRVCEHFNGPAPTPKHEAAHSCGAGNLGCCAPAHLSWKTRTENEADKLLHGTDNRGERHGMAKLTRADVLEIRSMIDKFPQREIAKQFGVSRITISDIKCGKNWGWLQERDVA